MLGQLQYDRAAFEAICRRARISEISLFGSALRKDFTAASDIDLLVTFEAGARVTGGGCEQG